jgi:hypothetical protein
LERGARRFAQAPRRSVFFNTERTESTEKRREEKRREEKRSEEKRSEEKRKEVKRREKKRGNSEHSNDEGGDAEWSLDLRFGKGGCGGRNARE